MQLADVCLCIPYEVSERLPSVRRGMKPTIRHIIARKENKRRRKKNSRALLSSRPSQRKDLAWDTIWQHRLKGSGSHCPRLHHICAANTGQMCRVEIRLSLPGADRVGARCRRSLPISAEPRGSLPSADLIGGNICAVPASRSLVITCVCTTILCCAQPVALDCCAV
jgi:hypothetical protein